jgi:sterol desaturase/sphingolipid hydroxylase (fatty acid hydroxylase superfamily)
MRSLLRYGLYPAVMLSGLWAALWLGARWGESVAVGLINAASMGLVAFLEWRYPYRARWASLDADFPADVWHMLVSMIGAAALVRALLFGLLYQGASALSAGLGASLWPLFWPLWAQLLLALAVAEFGYYWCHRLGHEWGAMWRLHATHHSVRRLYWLNSGHFHPLDVALNYACEVAPLILLGAPAEVMLLFSVFTGLNGMLKHSNLPQSLGVLRYVISAAEAHRWHHSKDPREGNTNYGSNLSLWDWLFGTFYLPSDREPPEDIGLSGDVSFPRGFLAQLASPFRGELWRS